MAGVGLEPGKGWWRRKSTKKHTVADFRRWFSLITTYNHMNFPTAAGEVETHKLQLSIVYHLLLFSVGVRRLPRSRFLASAMLSKDSTRDWTWKATDSHEKGRAQFEHYNLSKKPAFATAKLLPSRKSKGQAWRQPRQPFLVVVWLLWQQSGDLSSPGWDRHRTTRPGPRCVPPLISFFFTTP